MSLNCGTPPAMELFGTPEFRGGGSVGFRCVGWYASVTSFRFDESLILMEEVNCRIACGHVCVCLEIVEEANRRRTLDEVIGARQRFTDMMKVPVVWSVSKRNDGDEFTFAGRT